MSVTKYLRMHREKLEKLTQRCVNGVLHRQPADPFTQFLDQLSDYTTTGAFFSHVRCCPCSADLVSCEVLAKVRGSTLAVHSTKLSKALVARGLAKDDPEALSVQDTAKLLQAALSAALDGVGILSLAELDGRLSDAFGAAAEANLPQEEQPANCLLLGTVGTFLLEAAGRLLDGSIRDAVRASLQAQQPPILPAPALHCHRDLKVWEQQWPEILLPVFQSATAPRRRLCVGFTVWASLLPDASHLREDTQQSPPMGEQCPPLNSVRLMIGLAAPLASKIAQAAAAEAAAAQPTLKAVKKDKDKVGEKKGAAPPVEEGAGGPAFPAGEDFTKALSIFRKGLAAALPQYAASAPRSLIEQAEAAEAAARGRTPTPEPGKKKKTSKGTSGAKTASPEHPPQPQTNIRLDVRAEAEPDEGVNSCIFCLLCVDADAAFDAASGNYKFADAEAKMQGELIEALAMICQQEPLLQVLVEPLSPRDAEYAVGMERLCQALPQRVSIVEASGGEGTELPAGMSPHARARGYVQRIGGTAALSVASQCQRSPDSFSQKVGLYDFDLHPRSSDMLGMLGSCVDVALALPQSRRLFLLPRAGAEELQRHVNPMARQISGLALSAHRRLLPTDGRERTENLTLEQMQEGLKRLGCQQEVDVAPLHHALDSCKQGSISTEDFQLLQHFDGLASLDDLDELHTWLEGTRSAMQDAATGKDATDVETDRLHQFWELLDPQKLGKLSFFEFTRALRHLKYPHSTATPAHTAHLLALFVCLDGQNVGFIQEPDFRSLGILSSRGRLASTCRVRSFLEERFGGTVKAFVRSLALDDTGGKLHLDKFVAVMQRQHAYPRIEDVRACFQFLDLHRTEVLTTADFTFLEQFNEEHFVEELEALHTHLVGQHSSIGGAFDFFLQQRGPGTGAAAAEAEAGAVLTSADFLAGCRMSGFVSDHDPRLFFNFLDALHMAAISRTTFCLLSRLAAVRQLLGHRVQVSSAVTAVRSFACSGRDEFDDREEEERKGDVEITVPLADLHERLRAVTHHDLFV